MSAYAVNLAEAALENDTYRRVLHTGARLQLALMCLAPNESTGDEVHASEQFIRVEEGEGVLVADGEKTALTDGFAAVIPAGVKHRVTNVSATDSLRLYTVYAPPEHPPGLLEHTKPAGAFEGSFPAGEQAYDPRHECS